MSGWAITAVVEGAFILALVLASAWPVIRAIQKGQWQREFFRYEFRLKKLKPVAQPPDAEVLAELDSDMTEICKDLTRLLGFREIYRKTLVMFRDHPKLRSEGIFWPWLRKMYGDHVAVAIRRFVDDDSRAISLRNLATKVMNNPRLFTEERHMNFYRKAGLGDMGEGEFEDFAALGDKIIDRKKIAKDLGDFKGKAAPIKEMVDKLLAHKDRGGLARNVTYEDLDNALDTLTEYAEKYRLLIQCIGGSLTPTILTDWQSIFEYAWMPREDDPSMTVEETT
jgi:hypothetical protein